MTWMLWWMGCVFIEDQATCQADVQAEIAGDLSLTQELCPREEPAEALCDTDRDWGNAAALEFVEGGLYRFTLNGGSLLRIEACNDELEFFSCATTDDVLNLTIDAGTVLDVSLGRLDSCGEASVFIEPID